MAESAVTTIHGWVEFKSGSDWRPAIRIDELANRNYNLFGLLFGVRNHAGFSPIAQRRGLPDSCSQFVRVSFERTQSHSETWIGLSELKAIRYGTLRRDDPFFHAYHSGTGEELSVLMALSEDEHTELHSSRVLKKGPLVLKIEKLRRKDLLTAGWVTLVSMMDCLAATYGGEENVRLVCWFDNMSLPRIERELVMPGHSVYRRN